MGRIRFYVAIVAALAAMTGSTATATEPPNDAYKMQLPPAVRQWFRNPDGSCVQCSIGMCGVWQDVPEAYTLLWDTVYGERVRGGSWPSRVESYAERRGIKIYNVTGNAVWEWMRWAAQTGRFAAIGAGRSHFQTMYGWDPQITRWWVCNNNSPQRVDYYDWRAFQSLHLASGEWIVILDAPPSPRIPRYSNWWARAP